MADTNEGKTLAQSGVKGMKWGVRKNPNLTLHPDFTRRQQFKTANAFGRGGLRRVNARMHDGMTHKEAHRAELKRYAKTRGTVIGGVLAAHVLLVAGEVAAQKIAVKADGNRNAATNANIRGLPTRKASQTNEKNSYSPPNKQGVHKIHSL